MKKFLLSLFTALMAIGFVGCEYDDSDLWNEVNSLKDRVLTLEQLCQQMNTNISSLQSLVSALQNQDYITSVTPVKQGNDVIGYTITFAKGEPITIYHGQNGKDGQNGADGKDGYTPVIGVDKAEDGVYYWTLDGEWLTDADGNKIPTSGKDGADGEDGEGGNGSMPELKIQGGYWYVSYDGGENWERLGRATGYDGTDGKDGQDGQDGDSFFKSVTFDDNYVIFVLNDKNGTTIVVPRQKGQESLIALKAVAKNGGEVKLTGDVELDETLVIAAGKTVIIDLDGNDLTIASGNAIENNGILTIKGTGLINATTNYAIKNAGNLTILDDATISGQGGITSTAGKIVINNGDYTATSNWSNNTYNHILRAQNTQVIINGGTFDATIGGTNNAMLNAAGGSDITINGGEFKNASGSIPDFPPYIFTYENGGKLTINDGEFYGGWRFNNQATTDIYGGNFTVRTDGQSFQAGNPHVLKIHGGTFRNDNNANLSPGSYVTTGFKALTSNDGNSYIVEDNVDAVISAGANAQTALNTALADSNVETIVLTEGEFDVNLALPTGTDRDLTIIGNGETSISLQNSGGQNSLSIAKFDNLTIRDCEIKRMTTKNWGHLVFGASESTSGVYTIDNCTFNGVGTQGIYINTFKASGAIYNITNCTFNGNFGTEGAITIENYDNIYTVNVTGCTFNNIPATSHKIYIHYAYDGWTLNTDLANSDVYWKAK